MIMSPLLLLLAAQPAPAPAAVDVAMPSEIHNFFDWVVTCDNGLRCEAVSLVPEEQPEAEPAATTGGASAPAQAEQDPWERYGVMRFQRDAGAAAPLRIIIADFEGTPA